MTSTKLQKVVIVGRPNVGKSSIFNRIVGSRKAIVEASCGTTRDRLHKDIVWKGKAFTLVDTGGFEAKRSDDMRALILRQLKAGIAEADILIFVTDGSAGVAAEDIDLASRLRKTSKKIILVVNKIDDRSKSAKANDFFELGLGEPHIVSAVNYIGIDKLLDVVVSDIVPSEKSTVSTVVSVAIVGRPNVGKSSFLNALLKEERLIVHHVAGTTRDAIDINFCLNGKDFVLIDTAGLRHNPRITTSADFFGNVRSKEAIKRADVAIAVIDGFDGLREDDMRVIELVINEGKGLVIAVNKSDLITDEAMKEYKELLTKKMDALKNYPIVFTSCKTRQNVAPCISLAGSIYESSRAVIDSDQLKGILKSLRDSNEITGKRITILYMKQESARQPKFTIGIKSPGPLNNNTRRYIENFLRRSHDFGGVPIKVIFDIKNKNTELN